MNLIEIVSKYTPEYRKKTGENPYQERGVLPSEALLICSIIKDSGIKNLYESGRARGYSTKIFGDFFRDDKYLKITSIDIDRNSNDSKYSEKILKEYKNINLIYGDSTKMLSEINKKSVVFIDGPKGDEAIILACDLIKNKNIKYIFIHDLHKDTFHRNLTENIFNNVFFTDNLEYVKNFRNIDDNAWKSMEKNGEKPYVRKNKNINSYGSTLAMITNGENPLNESFYRNYLKYFKELKECNMRKIIIRKISKYPSALSFLIKIKKYVTKK